MAMAGLKNRLLLLLFLLPLLSHFSSFVDSYYVDFPSAKHPASWKNNPSNEKGSVEFTDGCVLRPVLLVYNKTYPPFGLGFFRNTTSISSVNSFYLVVFMLTRLDPNVISDDEFEIDRAYPPQIIWSANRDKPVGENATLDFTAQGELVLKDADGSPVWAASTASYSVAHVEITAGGNLMLLNASNGMVWQSFDHPIDTWLPNQKIYSGQRLTARHSSSNLSTGIYYLSVITDKVLAFLDSTPPKQYADLFGDAYASFSFKGFQSSGGNLTQFKNFVSFTFDVTPADFRYIVLEPNGHLTLYRVESAGQFGFQVSPYVDLLNILTSGDSCIYPTVCGHYGVCLGGGLCGCPLENNGNPKYFRPYNPDVGCAEITPLSCKDGSKYHTFVELTNVTYFDFVAVIFSTNREKCKAACLSNCSCKAAFFRYKEDVSTGNCSLQSDELYSFRTVKEGSRDSSFNAYSFIKVQKEPEGKKLRSLVSVMIPSLIGGLLFITFVASMCYRYRKLKSTDDADEKDDEVTEALTKFSFDELKSNTQNFQMKLGQGGFGAVFEGDLCNGTKVAVKCLDSVGQGRKEFLAEVNTIGKVEHFHLVKLIGYCAEKSNRLLVYEHMGNGSLDRWIFDIEKSKTLGWKIRQKIVYGVAKGLQYLHEECHMNIIHFDIKPQNILLDGDFNAKISDFGLARLIDRNQSLVLTTLKGTIGYLAPELFKGMNISVKADVYSFGIVILETMCGRKNLDSSHHQSTSLVDIVRTKVEEDQLYDLIDERNKDIRDHQEEAIKMIKIGIWCLQTHDRRPSMSMVVKVLEGSADMDLITDHQFLTVSHIDSTIQVDPNISYPPEAAILSGPR